MSDLLLSSTPKRETLIKELEKRYQLAERVSYGNCMAYLNQIIINSVPPKPFRVVAEPWQWALNHRVIPAIEYAANVRKVYDGPRKFWLTLPKGHDKTTMIGRLLNWAIGFPQTHLTAYAAAKDREQAALIVDAMTTEVNLNPWLKKRLEFKNFKVLGANYSKLHVLACDAGGSQGIRGDLLIVDELTQWTNQKFFSDLISGIDKRPKGVLIIITNAGVVGSWQWDALQEAHRSMQSDRKWWVYEAPYALASWMDRESINQVRRMMPDAYARMLFDNVWINPTEGCEYLTRDQCLVCEDSELPVKVTQGQEDRTYFAAIDYGPVKDRTALCLLHREGEQLVVDDLTVLQGSKENHVPISKVEEWIDWARNNFRLDRIVIDKYQMESTIQKYQGLVHMDVFEPRGTSGNHAIAENFRHLVINKQIRWHPSCGLLMVKGKDGSIVPQTLTDELTSVAVKIMPNGYRVYNPPGTHDDRVVSVAMVALYAMRATMKRDLQFSDIWF